MRKYFYTASCLFLFCSSSKESKTVTAGLKMQDFVVGLSKYARGIDPDFIVVPQNGAELAFTKLNPDAGVNKTYMDAIDGFGIEELFFNEKGKVDKYRLGMLQKLQAQKKVMVSELITKEDATQEIIAQNEKENFLCFPRSAANEDYKEIPAITNENTNDITKLADAKNYLYLINSSNYKQRFYYLKDIAQTNYDVVIIDLFFHTKPFTPDEIKQLQTKANGGKRIVLAYISIGSAENFRYYWDGNWIVGDPKWIKKKYEGYRDEFYVEYWNPEWQKIIYGNDQSYMKKILDAGFDGAYLDNVEAYYFLYNK
ncbi:endo alpha-1,4 polygalactosaminidase [Flavobacterium caeni]|uniref:Glycoside-hydrolase family GH114 TIM-barrel domain-containing protein n=1 Tax=Flavobacterium caeni TaxID=490189 RepID=A0A1G5CVP3_9FLAO|nr:endo alpha-1,4 polygalactosaminidase [Flavobacterium caeni]SCY06466.1 cysteinyl-tRNA synthetase, unknown class [Flavobacterium caeni]